MAYIKNTVLAICLLLVACRKDYSFEKPPTPPVQPLTVRVLTTGFAEDITATRIFKSVYWIDSTLYPLEAMANRQTFTQGIAVYNNQVVVAGCYTTDNSFYSAIPCYWLDGKRYDLPTNGGKYTPSWLIENLGIAIAHNSIYIPGIIDNKHIVWKIYNGKVQIIQLPYPKNWDGSDSPYYLDFSITASDNTILLSGMYSNFSTIKKQNIWSPVFWEIDAQNNITSTTPENEPNYTGGSVRSCASSGNNIYAIGLCNLSINNNSVLNPCIWTRVGRLPLTFPVNDIEEFLDIEVDNNGDIHALAQMKFYSRQIYTINPQGQLISKTATPLAAGAAGGYSTCISVNQYGSVLAVFYTYPLPRKTEFFAIKNNIFIPLRFNFQYFNATYGITDIKLVQMQ